MDYVLIVLVVIMVGSSGIGGFSVIRGQHIVGRTCSFLFAVSALVYGFTQESIFDKTGIIVLSMILVAGITGGIVGAVIDNHVEVQKPSQSDDIR